MEKDFATYDIVPVNSPCKGALIPIQRSVTSLCLQDRTGVSIDAYSDRLPERVIFRVVNDDGVDGVYGPNAKKVTPTKEAEFVDIYV